MELIADIRTVYSENELSEMRSDQVVAVALA